MTVRFIPDDAPPIQPYAGYLRMWLAEGFLGLARTWGADRFPLLHGGVSLTFLGSERATFTTLNRPPDAWRAPGAQLNFPITTLLPFNGGTVEVEAALYEAREDGPLGTAIDLLGGFAALMGPPLATAASIAEKVSEGLDTVVSATGSAPALALHATMVSPGGGPNVLRPGHLVVLNSNEAGLAGVPEIHNGQLNLRSATSCEPPVGLDYLVVRIECRTERDDWRFPELDLLVRTAGDALIRGHRDTYDDVRKNAIARAWNSDDLTPGDRRRVALLVADELDALDRHGIVPGADRSLSDLASTRLAHPDDPRLRDLTLGGLLGSGR
ncbi:hypothetical protein H7X46_12175 [Pseudonocardia sp. C8]|uniref:hypothetical protein n=1 Tax=Pseudonocardia sp. C8 TaxID=2762759 RepID=UPI00164355FC|nr:hypothetical protein [Pseudonocardia sp. C8]MBC3191820.1 hypothetical protein [Pseudonocardia sp. C8]